MWQDRDVAAAWALQKEVTMKISKETTNVMAWGSFLVACIAALFFPTSRIAGVIALITWIIVIVARNPLGRRRSSARKNSN